jgi:hypothetical protein
VVDLLGDFTTGTGAGTKSWHTILIFQTGTGDPATSGGTPAVYALDITNPASPTVVWEYTTPAVRGNYELGVGLTIAAGSVNVSGSTKLVAYAQTNNGGTNGAGTVVIPIDLQTGTTLGWQFAYRYPNPPRVAADSSVSATGIPGGAVGVDKTGAGLITNLVFDDLYGNVWEISPSTGVSDYKDSGGGNIPLFSFSTDYHAIGAKPAIYSDGSAQYAVIVSGGYADPSDSQWGTGVQQYVVAMALNYPTSNTTSLNEGSGTPYIKNTIAFGSTSEKGYAQALIVGNQVFITTDSTDVNATGYGTTGSSTGHMYSYNLNTNASGSTVVVYGGASSPVNDGTTVLTGGGSANSAATANTTTGPSVDSIQQAKVSRTLWLRTE